jgi:hypothetical protein
MVIRYTYIVTSMRTGDKCIFRYAGENHYELLQRSSWLQTKWRTKLFAPPENLFLAFRLGELHCTLGLPIFSLRIFQTSTLKNSMNTKLLLTLLAATAASAAPAPGSEADGRKNGDTHGKCPSSLLDPLFSHKSNISKSTSYGGENPKATFDPDRSNRVCIAGFPLMCFPL